MAEAQKLGLGSGQGETGDDDGVGLELAWPARRTVQGHCDNGWSLRVVLLGTKQTTAGLVGPGGG